MPYVVLTDLLKLFILTMLRKVFLVNASTGIFLLSVQPSTEMLKECGKYAKSSDRIICSSGCFPTLCSAVVLERKSSKTSFLHWLLLTSIDVITVAVHRHYVSAYMSKLVSYWRTKKYNERYCFVCLLFKKKKNHFNKYSFCTSN